MPGESSSVTTTALLDALADPAGQTIWTAFDARYRPILHAVARRMGLEESDAQDVAQQTLVDFARAFRSGGYERGRGRLSAWIIGIARHRGIDILRARAKQRGWRGDSAILSVPDEDQLSQAWNAEQQRLIFEQAWHALRTRSRIEPGTLRAFEMFALEGVPAVTVAEVCGITVAEVYRTKNRITRRLRDYAAELTSAYAAEE